MVPPRLSRENEDMRKEDEIRKNLDLLNEFMKYAFENPQVLDQIPSGAEVIILPLDDPEMMRQNRKMADAYAKTGRPVILVKLRKPEVVSPELELLKG